jgi:uncharacterized damage-inducible protein DinB
MAEDTGNILVQDLLWRMDQAYSVGHRYSLGAVLQGLTEPEAVWVPQEGERPILELLLHIAGSKILYENHAFGAGDKHWRNLGWPEWRLQPVLHWLDAAQKTLRDRLLALGDADLAELRPTHWGERLSLRVVFNLAIQHDIYHAGEIHCLRCLQANEPPTVPPAEDGP